jgi:heme/copper-type cytochrome/quinol oxidase subunit 1
MKKSLFSTPKHYIVVGLVGFLFCAGLLYVIENLMTAPNDETLFYRQSIVFFVVLVFFILSLGSFLGGIWGALQRKFSKQG